MEDNTASQDIYIPNDEFSRHIYSLDAELKATSEIRNNFAFAGGTASYLLLNASVLHDSQHNVLPMANPYIRDTRSHHDIDVYFFTKEASHAAPWKKKNNSDSFLTDYMEGDYRGYKPLQTNDVVYCSLAGEKAPLAVIRPETLIASRLAGMYSRADTIEGEGEYAMDIRILDEVRELSDYSDINALAKKYTLNSALLMQAMLLPRTSYERVDRLHTLIMKDPNKWNGLAQIEENVSSLLQTQLTPFINDEAFFSHAPFRVLLQLQNFLDLGTEHLVETSQYSKRIAILTHVASSALVQANPEAIHNIIQQLDFIVRDYPNISQEILETITQGLTEKEVWHRSPTNQTRNSGAIFQWVMRVRSLLKTTPATQIDRSLQELFEKQYLKED